MKGRKDDWMALVDGRMGRWIENWGSVDLKQFKTLNQFCFTDPLFQEVNRLYSLFRFVKYISIGRDADGT